MTANQIMEVEVMKLAVDLVMIKLSSSSENRHHDIATLTHEIYRKLLAEINS